MASTMYNGPRESRSIAALFGDLWRETSTLFRAETELATAELGEKVSQVQTAVLSIGIGIALLTAAFIILLMAAANGLAPALPERYASWLSPLIIGAVVAVVGIAVLAAARNRLAATSLKPRRTVRALRDDADLGREHLQ
jgi:xanthine/uracil permease